MRPPRCPHVPHPLGALRAGATARGSCSASSAAGRQSALTGLYAPCRGNALRWIPLYAEGCHMRLRKEPSIQVKSPEQIERMYAAGQVVARTLTVLKEAVAPGVSTAELDAIAEREIRGAGAVPSFLGYFGYPASICTSVNKQVVHGIPSKDQVLAAGDVISIDCGAILDGWHGDSAVSVGVGEISPADQAMLDACEAAMWAGIAQAVAGQRLGDVSHVVESSVRRSGNYGLIREYTGHGIGTEMHMDPVVRNYGPPGQGP